MLPELIKHLTKAADVRRSFRSVEKKLVGVIPVLPNFCLSPLARSHKNAHFIVTTHEEFVKHLSALARLTEEFSKKYDVEPTPEQKGIIAAIKSYGESYSKLERSTVRKDLDTNLFLQITDQAMQTRYEVFTKLDKHIQKLERSESSKGAALYDKESLEKDIECLVVNLLYLEIMFCKKADLKRHPPALTAG